MPRRHPDPGKPGVTDGGALAELLLVDGAPLANLDPIANPEKNFVVVKEDGVIQISEHEK